MICFIYECIEEVVIILIEEKYYRPSEVELLIIDSKNILNDLVKEMVEEDCKL